MSSWTPWMKRCIVAASSSLCVLATEAAVGEASSMA
eukprot:CAMPEP_0171111942 /NCGR_PEP_ID=MMETSP0766_2-20121228/77249_1 /TAXON_ID=439317 /ORGANISM="Gambierdiscus australes, Strain CAWD 149" /LENGTH=35 /DNA_ID= /DNA_START= /DNA_END= /DNA_ORIENTATION=